VKPASSANAANAKMMRPMAICLVFMISLPSGSSPTLIGDDLTIGRLGPRSMREITHSRAFRQGEIGPRHAAAGVTGVK